MTRIALLSTAIITGLLVTGTAQARGFGGAGAQIDPPSFAELDANGDGKVTAEEMQAYRDTAAAERFKLADTDGDGKLSAEELTASREQARADRMAARQNAMIERLDTDGDGLVSEEEMKAARDTRTGKRGANTDDRGERMINRFDIDNDGGLSEAEFAKMQELSEDRMANRGDKGSKGGKRGHGGRDGGGFPFWRN